mgnify:CR=1 FL=1
MERFTTKAMKKSSDEESKKTPAITATLAGRSSCEELRAQLVALERTKQGLREEAKSQANWIGIKHLEIEKKDLRSSVVCPQFNILAYLKKVSK